MKATDRNNGLISISKNEMDETRRWEEGRVTIDIINNTLNFDVFFTETIEEYKKDYEEVDINNIKVSITNPCIITFEDFLKDYDFYGKNCIIYDNIVYQPIEWWR